MAMNQETLTRRLQELAPFAGPEDARRAFDATLRALRRGLNEDEADWLALALGPALAAPLLREGFAGELPPEELFRWTKRYGKTRKGVAVEQTQVVCRVLTELLPQPDLERLKKHLPAIAHLFTLPEEPEPGVQQLRSRSPGARTLATGRPGSTRPVSEAGGPSDHDLAGGVPDRAHSHSVARARDPHVDTKLSSAHGLAQERERRTLASAGEGGARR